MVNDLKKAAIVTGAASGFGAAIEQGEKTATAISALAVNNPEYGRAVYVRTDVTCRESWEALVKAACAEFGTITCLVNNAGGASVINIASTGGVKGRPGLTWYSASKAACISVTQTLAIEFAPSQLRVNAVLPVLGMTPLMIEFMGGDAPEQIEAYAKTVPLQRFAEPQDIANAVAYLASAEASFVTGVCLPVDGGRLAAGKGMTEDIKNVTVRQVGFATSVSRRQIVKQHIDSFNYFVDVDLQAILRANSRITSDVDPNFFLEYEDIRVGAPERPDENAINTSIAPHECRLRDLSYSAPVFVNIRYTRGRNIVVSKGVRSGRLPIMLRSNNAPSTLDGGYFVVKGTEKVILVHLQRSKDRIIVETGPKKGLEL
ncbi:DNA-directed RNA polymerase III subunit RPC2 [Pseudohyphozyma bogoriensis]|nr:DNA-directed RNA polymerase III subunit RPC2 [Pseudohyphozyma bogoriensis]